MRIDLNKYLNNKVDQLDCVTTGISIERRHKVFLETNKINLSALVRDILSGLIEENTPKIPKK